MDDELIKDIDKLNSQKNNKLQEAREKFIEIEKCINEKIKPVLDEYFKKMEDAGGKITLRNVNPLHYKIEYGGKIFVIRKSDMPSMENYDFGIEYRYEGSGVGHVRSFDIKDIKEHLNEFILSFHKYLLEFSH